MDVKANYEESWRLQRQREAGDSGLPSALGRLRRRLTTTRYEVAEQQVRSIFAPRKGSVLADIGCGRGEMIYRLGMSFERVIGVDVSSTELGYLKSELPIDIQNRVALQDVNLNGSWPIDDQSCDVVTCLAVLEHLFDPYAVAAELHRICRPGGHVVVEVPNIAYWEYRLSLLAGKFPSTSGDPVGWDGGHLHYFTVADLHLLFSKTGLRIVNVSAGGLLSGLRSTWPTALGRDVSVLLVR